MIASPCNDVCTTDSESNLCIGCGRTKEEIANYIYFLISEKNSFMTNETITVSGGE